MKSFSKHQNNSNAENSAGKKQAEAGTILQAYKSNHLSTPVTQLESYSETVTRSEDITATDLNDWGIVRTKLGGIAKGKDANSKIAERANKSLAALGLNKGTAMSAHMIPNRIGGAGGAVNVRPWDVNFETGTWETDVEQEFNNAVVGKAGEDISYKVETTEMDDAYYDVLKSKSTVADGVKNSDVHKTNIQQIPVEVSATVGGKSLTKTSEPIDGLAG